ncbi:hypothetical protein [Kaistia terrae]|uniref:Uncharacterized protein n=1 Tax=Kaistia terrae TaxID=537017 RepID=A0ABW0PZH9_9HYPH|nr:hypothetical protein [Kaistia terrae]MCX5580535.1 hypothetical protein [Kaistia terrae]
MIGRIISPALSNSVIQALSLLSRAWNGRQWLLLHRANVDAIVCGNDVMTIGAQPHGAEAAGYYLPRAVGIKSIKIS